MVSIPTIGTISPKYGAIVLDSTEAILRPPTAPFAFMVAKQMRALESSKVTATSRS